MIPDRTIESLRKYVEHGIPTGDFLYAVLTNNLMESFGRADDENREALFEIYEYVYNKIPSSCHGSKAAVAAWLDKFKRDKIGGYQNEKDS